MSNSDLDYNARVRQVGHWLRAIVRSLLIEPEQLGHELAFGLALVPPLALGVFFFRRPAALLIALCLLTGIVCWLALRLASLSIGVPAWIGHKANHPLIASLLVACFLPSTVAPWLGVALVLLLIVLDTVLWPQLHRLLVHPALLVFGIGYLVERQLGVGFVNPFDGRPLDDPLTLWYRLRIVIDPTKLYVGNVPGPLGATSIAALLLGIAYLWYTRKISLGVLWGFLLGVAVASLAFRYNLAFQLSSGPALFLVGYLAADRRRLPVDERGALVIGVLAGGATVALRAYGQGPQAAWEALLLVGAFATLALRVFGLLATRSVPVPAPAPAIAALRSFTVRSGQAPAHSAAAASMLAPARAQVVSASSASALRVRPRPISERPFAFEDTAPDDIVQQMRRAASRQTLSADLGAWALWVFALVVFNPVGLWMTWTSVPISRLARVGVSLASVFWYAALGALVLALLHRLP